MTGATDHENIDGIAVIAMSGRFPGAENVDRFWENLISGVETISRFSPEDLEFSVATAEGLAQGHTYVSARAILENVDQFDASFFGIYPREAEIMDPQHRLFLECAWEALESGGYDPDRYSGLIGVYSSLSLNTYLIYNLCANRNFAANFAANYQVGYYQEMLGNDKDFLPTRVSYKLNLKGPSMSIQTACSSSLVAICQACNSLQNYQSDMILAGGVSVTFPQKRDYLYQEDAMWSADGSCRVFDAEAKGTVFGHGVAVLLLKRLSDAMADGDNILAVIKGSAVNNDGSVKIGYAAPSITAQADVIAMAQAIADVDPESISYIEAHGTGTPLGDPIEVAALTQAFRSNGAKRKGYCALGTCKTHIGHLDVASGATGLIKTILQLQHEKIPPLLHFKSPNPKIDFENSPFFPVTKPISWERDQTPRRAGVSAFGVGGTNAHVIVEEAPPINSVSPSRSRLLFILSAKTPTALEAMSANLAGHFENNPDLNLADAAYTLQNGRKQFAHRRAFVASDITDAVTQLKAPDTKSVSTGKMMTQKPSIVFMLPGQGTQYLNMGRDLYTGEAVFREAVDRCAEILNLHMDIDIRSVLYPESTEGSPAEKQINDTWLAQPAIFVVEYALASFLIDIGIAPTTLIGHSIGEYVAAVIADSLTLDDALSLLTIRAKSMQALPSGAMLSVRMGFEALSNILPADAAIAAVNSPSLCVVSGPTEIITRFQKTLESEGVAARWLHTSHAFHSPMMDPMLQEFSEAAARIPCNAPQMAWISTLTGRLMTREDFMGGEYWAQQIRQKVRFAEAVQAAIEDPHDILLEVGPGQTLCQLARQNTRKPSEKLILTSLGPVGEPDKDITSLLGAVGKLWASGVEIDWKAFSAQERRRRIPLPTYPFERKSYWVEPGKILENQQSPSQVQTPMVTQSQQTENQTKRAEPASIEAVLPSRKDRLIKDLHELFQQYSGADHSQVDPNETFMDLGFDSLLVTQASLGIKKRFGVKITFRQLLEDYATFETLAAFLDKKMPADPVSSPGVQALPAAMENSNQPENSDHNTNPKNTSARLPGKTNGLLASVIQQQMAIMNEQLNLLRRASDDGSGISIPTVSSISTGSDSMTMEPPPLTAVNLKSQSHFGPFKSIEKGAAGGLTEKQQSTLKQLVKRYNRKTAKSKSLAQQHRRHFCDPRAAGNFRQLWKEMVYPIACARSKGSRIWDIDGNEYIDITMGFGANYLGHSPDFVMQALSEQLKLGVEIGPQSPIAGEVARMICEFTGMDRATFCNTGSEAVMASFRVARTVTGRDKIVYFYGDYHGVFDEVLGRPAICGEIPSAMPIAPGVPRLSNIMVLEYGNPASLENIRRFSEDIAAVIVEPVQARHPELQPRQFLHELRKVTADHEIALIFDEVITGFRVSPGGAQEYFGVKADMATYGKVVGGGMPIGVLAGTGAYMDALDGGFWQYGDDSSPPTGVTFFAGTFVRHPLAMAAAHAVLKYLKAAGPKLQERTNERTEQFVTKVNHFFEERGLPLRFQAFSAMFYYDFHPDLKYAGLLFYYLRDRGIHIWEGRVGHLSIAHTDEDLDRVFSAIQESVTEMQNGGFLPESTSANPIDNHAKPVLNIISPKIEPSGEKLSVPPPQTGSDRFSLSESQHEMWLGAQMSPEAAGPHHACTGLYLDGELDLTALKRAIDAVVGRHEGLRSTFSEDGSEVIVHPSLTHEIQVHDLSTLSEPERDEQVNGLLHRQARHLFDLTRGPLVDFQLVKISPQRHLLIFTAQMIVCDGWSHYVVFEELGTFYTAFVKNQPPELEPAIPMREFANWEQSLEGKEEAKESEAFWRSQFAAAPPPVDLPTKGTRPPVRTSNGARRSLTLPPPLYREIKQLGKAQKNSYFAVLLAAFQAWLYRLSGTKDLVVGVPFAAQNQLGMETLVGQGANTLPLRLQLDSTEPFKNILEKSWGSVLDAQEHWNFTYGRLITQLDLPRDASRIPLASILFNLDPPMDKVKFENITHRFFTGPRYYFQYDLGFNLVETEETIVVECDYNPDLFDGEVVACWLEGYRSILETVVINPECSIGSLPIADPSWLEPKGGKKTDDINVDGNSPKINEVFEAQANVTPDATAIDSRTGSTGCRELDRFSSRLANHLTGLGIDNVRLRSGENNTLDRFISGTELIVLDERKQILPAGIPGELFLSAPHNSSEYQDSSLSIEQGKNESAMADKNSASLLSTGNRARYLPDGRIEILGFTNRCLNKNGIRFQLEDVESALMKHSTVKDAVVCLQRDIEPDDTMVAYIVLRQADERTVSFGIPEKIREIRRVMRHQLPGYMVPDRFAVLDKIPLGTDGQVEYAALPFPIENDFDFADFVAPRSETEKILAAIWQDLLKIDQISVRDNFFDLGGQSLLAVRMFARLEKELGAKYSVALLFRAPTIELLARKLTDGSSASLDWPSLVPIQPTGTKPPLFLVHGAGGNVLLYRSLAKRLEPDYPLYGLQSQGLDGQSRPLKTIEEMADRYLTEIRSVQPNGPYLIGGYCLGGTIAYEMAQRLTTEGEHVGLVAMLDTYNFIRALKVGFITFLIQKFKFHWGNFYKLSPWAMWKYIREKKRIAGEGGWAHIRTERPGTTLQSGVARAESGIEASIQELNDHAADIYDPKPYPGILTLFKPQINYKFYPDPKLGWGDLALGGLDIVEMPFNPHAMLVEPYVELLSSELKTRLDNLT